MLDDTLTRLKAGDTSERMMTFRVADQQRNDAKDDSCACLLAFCVGAASRQIRACSAPSPALRHCHALIHAEEQIPPPQWLVASPPKPKDARCQWRQ